MSIAQPTHHCLSALKSESTELWRRKPGTAVLFDNASHKSSAQSASRRAGALLGTLADAGWNPRRIDAHDIGMKHALATLRESCADLVLAFGGDGTVAACAEIAVDRDVPLLPIPGGTMNLTAKDLGVWDARSDLVDLSMLGAEHRVDVASVNGRTFLHSLATGLVPAIGRQREAFRSRRSIAGRFTAVADAARIALTLERQLIELRTGSQSAQAKSLSIVVSNNRLVRHHDVDFGRASVDAGELGLYVSTHRGPIGRYQLMQSLLTGQLELDRRFHEASAHQVSLHAEDDSIAVSVDGEVLTMKTPLVVTQQHRALRVIVPASHTGMTS